MNKPVKLPFEFMGKDGTRTGAMHFMRVFSTMVKNGESLPDDYLECAAQLLEAAADAAEEPVSKKRATSVMKAMNLSGREDTGYRDFYTARIMLYMIELQGMTHSQAMSDLSVELGNFGAVVPDETLLSIFKRYPREEVEQSLYPIVASLINLGKDPHEYICNYQSLAHYFK